MPNDPDFVLKMRETPTWCAANEIVEETAGRLVGKTVFVPA